MKLPVGVRLGLVPIASMAACSGTVTVASVFGDGIRPLISLDVARAIEAAAPTDVRAGLLYATAAAAWVLAGALTAPVYRIATALVLYAAGAWLAWMRLDGWYFPEGYPRGYQTSSVPLVLTLIGGLVGVAAIIVKSRFGGGLSRTT